MENNEIRPGLIQNENGTLTVTFDGSIRYLAGSKVLTLSQAAETENGNQQENENEDWAIFPFRLLSATTIWGHGYPLDFSRKGVVQKAAELFEGKTIYPNHNWRVENWLGKVRNSKYNTSTDPAGIDADLYIHRKKKGNDDIILGLETDAIEHDSVTMDIEYEMSHPDMKPRDFWEELGKTGDDGELVRLIVTEIITGYEVSLVWLGADHTASKLPQGNTAPQSTTALSQNINNDPKEKNKMTLLEKLKETYLELVKDSSITIDTEGDLVQAIKTALNENASLKATKKKLEAQVQQLKLFETFHADLIQEIKNSCTAAAKLLNGTGATEPSTTHKLLIEQTTDYDSLVALQKELDFEKRKLFPATCQHCGQPVGEIRSSVEMPVAEGAPVGAVTQAKKEGPFPASGLNQVY